MIVVTVGTHEQPFDRLIAAIDRLVAEHRLDDEVLCQYGYSRPPQHAGGAPMVPFADMQRLMLDASAVVSHGGPGSILPVLAAARPLVLVPRQQRFGEHVDDHQVAFCRRIGADRGVPVVEDIDDLEAALITAVEHPPLPRGAGRAAPGLAGIETRLERLLDARRHHVPGPDA